MERKSVEKILLCLTAIGLLIAVTAADMSGQNLKEIILAEDFQPSLEKMSELKAYDSLGAEEVMETPMPGELRLPEASEVACYSDLPRPQLELIGTEDYSTADGQFTRYKLSITNWEEYPEALFRPAPDLPPCGLNANSARAWVYIWAEGGAYIYSFCDLSSPLELEDLWVALPRGEAPPEQICVTINDRDCGQVLQSDFISTRPAASPTPGKRDSGTGSGTSGDGDWGTGTPEGDTGVETPMPGEMDLPEGRLPPLADICYPDLPAPQLIMTGTQDYSTAAGEYTRYNLAVTNRADYPAELFQPAPDLPPCGSNANSARAWVNIYDGSDNYLYGFCALSSPADLGNLWFALRRGETPPRSAYIVIEDRKCGNSYRSNAASIARVPGIPEGSLSAPVQLSPADGSVFSHYPRSTTLEWSPVAGAATYTVEIDCYHCCVTDRWCSDSGTPWSIVPGITGTSYAFDYVGKQPGRWRVWAVKASGEEGPKSGWWDFEYTI